MSSVSPLKQIWPEAAEMTPEQTALAALRQQIDTLDDALLDLFQQRLALASRVGQAKDAPAGPHTKLRPDREQAVLSRVLAQATPDTAEAVEALWREIVGWGLNRQGQLQVQVWAPTDPTRAWDGARLRFGRAADLRLVHDPEAALRFAADGHGVAVLGLNGDSAWWTALRREWSSLSVFDGFGGDIPTSLAVAKIDPAALPSGRRVVVSAGGDAGVGSSVRRWGLATHHGWTLSLTEAALAPGEIDGCVGAIG